MSKKNQGQDTGTAEKVEKFLMDNVGSTFTAQDVRIACDLRPGNNSIISKLHTLQNQGKVALVIGGKGKVKRFKVLPKIKGKEIAIENSDESSNQLVPLTNVLTAPPIDVALSMQYVLDTANQNKVYRNALEQIALILDQAGIIESIKE